MSKYSILIVDDENMTHVILKALLGAEYNLHFANNAQEAIDILSETPVHLILLDVQMPDISGIELLESLMIDSVLRSIPVIIITGKATDDIVKKANDLGAAYFIKKEVLFKDKEFIHTQIHRRLSPDAKRPELLSDYKENFRNILKSILKDSVSGDLISASRKLGTGIMNSIDASYLSIWTIRNARPNLIMSLGDKQPENFGPEELVHEQAYKDFISAKKPYLTNNPSSGTKGIFPGTALQTGLSSEIGVPLYEISKDNLLHNNMKVPQETDIFGFVVIKRNRVFTTKEFKILSKFIIQAGTLLYAQYQNMFKKRVE